MGALHHIHVKDGCSDDDDEIGWAAGAWLNVTLPVRSASAFNITGQYADGAVGYISNFGDDFAIDGDGDVDTTTAWTVRAGLSAGFTDRLTANLDGSYTEIDPGGDDCDDDDRRLTIWAIVGNVVWSPASGLTMGPEVAYNHVEADNDSDDRWRRLGCDVAHSARLLIL